MALSSEFNMIISGPKAYVYTISAEGRWPLDILCNHATHKRDVGLRKR